MLVLSVVYHDVSQSLSRVLEQFNPIHSLRCRVSLYNNSRVHNCWEGSKYYIVAFISFHINLHKLLMYQVIIGSCKGLINCDIS